jgi:AcrR family transcriptional regulator
MNDVQYFSLYSGVSAKLLFHQRFMAKCGMTRKDAGYRDEIRLKVLDAAETIVAAEGYAGLSARKVASAAGCAVGTIYLLFKNIDDLVLQINGRTMDRFYDYLRTRYPENPQKAPEKALIALARAFIAYAQAETPRWNMLFEDTMAKGEVAPEWYLRKRARVFGLAEAALRAFTADEVWIAHASHVLLTSVYGICILHIRQRLVFVDDDQGPEEMADLLISNFLHGCLAPATKAGVGAQARARGTRPDAHGDRRRPMTK